MKRRWPIDNKVICFALFLSLLMGIAAYYCVPVSDDLRYSLPYGKFLTGKEDFPGFQPYKDFFIFHYLEFNGRFGDKLIALLMLVPRGLYGCLFGITFLLIFYISSKLTFSRGWRIILCSLIVLIIPSYETIFIRVIYLNYMLASMLSLWWLYWLLQKQVYSSFKVTLLFLYSVLMGSWHELYSVSLIFGSFLLLWKEKSYRDTRHIIMIVGLLLGSAFIALSKGNFMRTELLEPFSNFNWLDCLAGTWLGLIALIVCLGAYLRDSSRFSKTEIIVYISFLFIVVFDIGINLVHMSSPRHGWLVNLYGLLLIFALTDKYRPLRRTMKIVLGLVLGFVSVLNLLFTIYWQRVIWYEQEYLLREFKRTNGEVIYYDFGVPKYAYLLTLGKIEWFVFYELEAALRGQLYLGEVKELKVLPKELKRIDRIDLSPVGNNLYLTPERNIIGKKSQEKISLENIVVEDKKVKAVAFPFESEEGEKWVYYRPFYEYWNVRAWTDGLLR